MMNQLAQRSFGPPGGGGFIGFGLLGKKPLASGITEFQAFITAAIGIMTLIAIVWFVFTFITGAVGIISSGGDKNALEAAKKKMTSAIVGLVLVIIGIFVLDLIGYLLGVPILDIFLLFFSSLNG